MYVPRLIKRHSELHAPKKTALKKPRRPISTKSQSTASPM